MSITPIPPPGSPGFSTPVTPSTSQSVDQNYYSSSISSGQFINIVDFSHGILSAQNTANEVTWVTQQTGAVLRNPLYDASTDTILGYMEIYTLISMAAGSYNNAYTENQTNVNNLYNSVNNYNNQIGSDQNAVNTLNSAIITYNNGVYKTQAQRNAALQILQNATNNYNSYAQSRNTNINQTKSDINVFNNVNVPATNQTVASVNSTMNQFGYPSLNDQAFYSGGTPNLLPIFGSPPTSTFSNTTSAIAYPGNTMSASGARDAVYLASTLFSATFELLINQFALTTKILDRQTTFIGYIQFYLQTNLPFLPPAFLMPIPQPLLSSGGEFGSGAGVSLGSIVTTLSNVLFERIIANGMFSANMALQSMIPSMLASQFQFLNIQLLSQIGLLSGTTALNLLAGKLASLGLNSQAVTFAVSLAVAQEIQYAVSNGIFQNGISALLRENFPSLNGQALAYLTPLLAAPFELQALNLGIFQLAQALRLPLLFGQIFSNLSLAVQLGIVRPQPSIVDILNHAASLNGLKAAAAFNLSIGGYSQLQSLNIINKSIAEATRNGSFDKNAYAISLQNQGITWTEATTNANNMESYLNSERNGFAILNQAVVANIILNNRISQSIAANELVRRIVNESPNLSYRQLRDRLVEEFVKNGTSYQDALNVADLTVLGPPLLPISLQVLSSNLQQKSYENFIQLGYSPSDAQTLANQVVTTVLGPAIPGSQTSFRLMMEEKLNLLVQLQNNQVLEEVKNNMLAFLAPTMELSVFAARLRDPANSILLSALTGIMYSGTQPSNFLRNIDINV